MSKNIMIFKNSWVIIFIFFFIGASTLPSISGTSGGSRGVLFEDDFNDNTKDTSKWSEIDSQGEWWEINEICQLYLIGSGNPISEKIESNTIQVRVSQDLPLIISIDMNTKVSSNTEEGRIHFKVDAGLNWVWTVYDRANDYLLVKDSNDADWTIIGHRGDGTWDNEVQIFPDRYYVQMDGFNSGWVIDSLFSSTTQLKMVLYIELDASLDQYINVGYDNAKVEIENRPPGIPSQPSGPQTGKAGESLTYKISSTDPDGDHVFYMFDWDDDTTLEWEGPFASGVTASISHAWSTKGFYQIRVKSKDIWGDESDWSDSLAVNLPRTRISNNNFLMRLFECFPYTFPLLRLILQRL